MSLAKLQGIIVLVDCTYCKSSGQVKVPPIKGVHHGYQLGEMKMTCPNCRGSKTVQESMSIEDFLALIRKKVFGPEGMD